VLGLAGGLVSVAFTKLLLRMRDYFLRLPRWTCWFQPLAGGLLTGLIAWRLPQVLGVGYGYVGDALNGRMSMHLMALLVVFKLLAVTTSYASGNAGGIFGPSLFIGAMLGGTVGSLAHHLMPMYTAEPGAYALVGMGALFAGSVRAPMTSVLMIFETTQDYAVIVPLMISNLISFFISFRLQREPIYESLAIQDGIHLPSGATRLRDAQRLVVQAMRPATTAMRSDMTVREALDRAPTTEFNSWPVTDDRGVVGVISLDRLEEALARGEDAKRLRDVIDGVYFPHVHADQPLHLALERMGTAKLDVLPVVSRDNVHHMIGVIVLPSIRDSYGLGRQ